MNRNNTVLVEIEIKVNGKPKYLNKVRFGEGQKPYFKALEDYIAECINDEIHVNKTKAMCKEQL